MTVEAVTAIIDDPTLDFEVGESIGKCEGYVEGYDRGGIVAQVFPAPKKCKECSLGEDYCSQSKAE